MSVDKITKEDVQRLKIIKDLHLKTPEINYGSTTLSNWLEIYFWPAKKEIMDFLQEKIGERFQRATVNVIKTITHSGLVFKHKITGDKGQVVVYQKIRPLKSKMATALQTLIFGIPAVLSPTYLFYLLRKGEEKFEFPMFDYREAKRQEANKLHYEILGNEQLVPRLIVNNELMLVTEEVKGLTTDIVFLENLGKLEIEEELGRKVGAALEKVHSKKLAIRDTFCRNMMLDKDGKILFIDGDMTARFRFGVPTPYKIGDTTGFIVSMILICAAHCSENSNWKNEIAYAQGLKALTFGVLSKLDLNNQEKKELIRAFKNQYNLLLSKAFKLLFFKGTDYTLTMQFAERMERAVMETINS